MYEVTAIGRKDWFDSNTGKQLLHKGKLYHGVTVSLDREAASIGIPIADGHHHYFSRSMFADIQQVAKPNVVLFKEGDKVEYIGNGYHHNRIFTVKRDQKPHEDYVVLNEPVSPTARSVKVFNVRPVAVEVLPQSDSEWSRFLASGKKLKFRSGCEAKFVAFVKSAKPHCQLVLLNPATGNIVTRYANGKGSTETFDEPGDIIIGEPACSLQG